MLDDFRFLQEATTQTAKFCIPAPSLAYHRGGRDAIEEPAYGDLNLFWDDVLAAYEAEINFLSEMGEQRIGAMRSEKGALIIAYVDEEDVFRVKPGAPCRFLGNSSRYGLKYELPG